MVKVGGDVAALKGIMKAVQALETEHPGQALDSQFIAAHTNGIEALRADLQATRWDDIEAASGIDRNTLESVAGAYVSSSATIVSYGMGITQHIHL
jgi:anaerobic selenocysteine-containing dehydrogenase